MKKIIMLVLIISMALTGSAYSVQSDTGGETMPNFDFKVDPNNIEGSLVKLMDYLKWFNAHLDETNIKHYTWGDSIVDNVDATHKLKLKFYIPDGILLVQKLTLNFSVEAFRAYETGAASGGASIETSESGGSGDFDTTGVSGMGIFQDTGVDEMIPASTYHVHNMDFTLPSHSHSLSIADHTHDINIPSHGHSILYGIYESTTAAGCKVYVDGTLRLDNGGAGYSTDQANLDLTQWVTTAGWHTIEISSTQLGRINAAYFIQIYAGNKGL
jgi:hypothetical protein